ncbi:hypothetical protein CBR_g36704 [Chara braunii]|uniref:HAT C-terminal dimerisation domain-containing protein n=1 Tax=Chara braunii TaxID=69332 RepID=A0A388LL74_CHABU|nr:hypothetical protein CBR_g36704 [Chara braunii]|eukprot:GBG83086.1 hypothetical protein CBR_g36704 [Chara braunii]
MEAELRPPPVPGREVPTTVQAQSVAVPHSGGRTSQGLDLGELEAAVAADPSCQASSSTTDVRTGKKTHTSIRKWVENIAQKRLDKQWGKALFRAGVPFNFVRQEETKALHDLYMELGAQKAKAQMTKFDTLRTIVLDAIFDEVKQTVQPIVDNWDMSGCTLITDGCTDIKFRLVLNFIGGGEGGAVLMKVVDAVVKVMRPVSEMLRRMDMDGTTPSQLWRFGDMLCARLENIDGMTREQLQALFALVDDGCKMMRQPAHAAHFLLHPTRRDPRWLLDMDSPLVQNAIKFFLSQLGGDRWGYLQSHLDVWQSLWTFHCEPPKEQAMKEPMWDEFGKGDGSLTRKTASQWWAAYGGKHKKLQKIATRVTAMWSTATPAERNWSSLDLVQTKRRNNLSIESVEILVYIHWNMQLSVVRRGLKCGFLDMWGTCFDDPEPPSAKDPAVLPGPLEGTEEEDARQAKLRKAPKGRIPKGWDTDDTSDSESSDEELIWSGKGENGGRRSQPARDAKGKATMVEESDVDNDELGEEEEEEEEDPDDPDFKLHPPGLDDDSEPDMGDRTRSTPPIDTTHAKSLSNLSFVMPALCPSRADTLVNDDADRAAARSLTERDHSIVQQRIEQDNARRVAVPPPSRLNRATAATKTGVAAAATSIAAEAVAADALVEAPKARGSVALAAAAGLAAAAPDAHVQVSAAVPDAPVEVREAAGLTAPAAAGGVAAIVAGAAAAATGTAATARAAVAVAGTPIVTAAPPGVAAATKSATPASATGAEEQAEAKQLKKDQQQMPQLEERQMPRQGHDQQLPQLKEQQMPQQHQQAEQEDYQNWQQEQKQDLEQEKQQQQSEKHEELQLQQRQYTERTAEPARQ